MHQRKQKRLLSTLLVGAVAAVAALAASGQGRADVSRAQPITVGFLNQEKGAIALPDFGAGARAARDYINAELGGINGRPLKFLQCFTDGSPESSIDCANKFVQARVVAVLQGVDFGSDATLPILGAAGIPLVGHTAFGAQQLSAKNAFFFGAGLFAFAATPVWVMDRMLGVKSFVYVAADNPVQRAFADGAVVPAAKKAGMKVSTLFYTPTNPDFTQVIASALANQPEAIFFTGPEPDCTGLVSAVAASGFRGPVFAGSCTDFIKAAPQAAEGVFTSSDLWAPSALADAPARKAKEVRTFVAQMKKRAPKYASAGFAQFTFSSTMDLASILRRTKGQITQASVLKQLRRTRHLPSFMGQPITCDGRQWPGQPTACAGGVIEYRVKNGVRRAFTRGFVNAKGLLSP